VGNSPAVPAYILTVDRHGWDYEMAKMYEMPLTAF